MHTRNTDLIEEFRNLHIDGEAPLENGDSVHEVIDTHEDYVHGVSLNEPIEDYVRDETQEETIDGERYVEAEGSTEGEVLVNGNEAEEEEWGMDNEGNQPA